MPGPFACMSVINLLTGFFSAFAGAKRGITEKAPWPFGKNFSTANPWLYTLGGTICMLIGVGNYYQFSLATWGTVLFICTSIYDGWFAAGSKDWRFYTLNAYAIFQSALILWSTQMKSPLTLP